MEKDTVVLHTRSGKVLESNKLTKKVLKNINNLSREEDLFCTREAITVASSLRAVPVFSALFTVCPSSLDLLAMAIKVGYLLGKAIQVNGLCLEVKEDNDPITKNSEGGTSHGSSDGS